MRRLNIASAGIAMLLLSGCAAEPASTSSPTTMITTTTSPETTTTLEAGPQPLPAGGFLDPGEYVTTVFEPKVVYRIENKHLLRPFQSERVTGFGNLGNRVLVFNEAIPYKGIAIHNHWMPLGFEGIIAELEELDIEYGPRTEVDVGGFPGTQMEATVLERSVLWRRQGVGGTDSAWWLEPDQVMRLVILDTPAGTLLITAQAADEEWDDFLPIAEEILDGISFPDL